MSETETRAWLDDVATSLAAERDAARAEVARLRETVATIFEAWNRLEDPEMSRAAHRAIDDALDSVGLSGEAPVVPVGADLDCLTAGCRWGDPTSERCECPPVPSGEAESGEPVTLSWLTCRSCRGRTLARVGSRCAHCNDVTDPTPAPVSSGGPVVSRQTARCLTGDHEHYIDSMDGYQYDHCRHCGRLNGILGPVSSGGQADGERQSHWLERWVAERAARKDAEQRLADVLAARPVLSREALSGHRLRHAACTCGRWAASPAADGMVVDQWRDHLVDVLAGEQR